MALLPVSGERALVDDESKLMVIADIHLGFELTLLDKGIHIPTQDRCILTQILSLLRKTRCEKLIINGDLVDPLFKKWRLKQRLHDFFSKIPCNQIHLVKGNHDARIEDILPPGVKLHPSTGMRAGKAVILHGHRRLPGSYHSCNTIVISHSHPALALRDELGISIRESCWLRWRGNNREIIVMPPFNPYMIGHPVNSLDRKQSPIFGQVNANFDECEVYLLDGSHLGKVSHLIRYGV